MTLSPRNLATVPLRAQHCGRPLEKDPLPRRAAARGGAQNSNLRGTEPAVLEEPMTNEMQLEKIVRKSAFIAIILAVVLGTASAQSAPQGPPAFVTLPRHPSIDHVRPGTDHPMPLRLELRDEMFEMVGVFRVGGNGGGNGGGKNSGGGGSDFGQNAAVAMIPDCFPPSPTNFDASC